MIEFQLDPDIQPEPGSVVISLASERPDRWAIHISGSKQFEEFESGPLYAGFRLDVDQFPEDLLRDVGEQWRGMLWARPFVVRRGYHATIEIAGFALADCAKCPDCSGRGQYVGFLEVEPCQPCLGTGRRPNIRGVTEVFAVGRPL